jgi:Domain of unknown function (DUF4349)
MTFLWPRAALIAALAFLALFSFRFFTLPDGAHSNEGGTVGEPAQSSFENARKNYASLKSAAPVAPGVLPGDVQKYEKVGTLTQSTAEFDKDKQRILEATSGHQGVIQLERATGLKGRQVLTLGIGVPPDKFDAFIEAAKAIGKNVQIDVVKNDKTNEYLQLKAKRTTQEKARTALEDLKASGGSVEERVNVQNRLTEVEEKIQDLGVSLGEFDTQNELCTVKLTLREARGASTTPVVQRILRALEWSAKTYALSALGFLGLIVGGWLAAGLVSFVRRIVQQARSG